MRLMMGFYVMLCHSLYLIRWLDTVSEHSVINDQQINKIQTFWFLLFHWYYTLQHFIRLLWKAHSEIAIFRVWVCLIRRDIKFIAIVNQWTQYMFMFIKLKKYIMGSSTTRTICMCYISMYVCVQYVCMCSNMYVTLFWHYLTNTTHIC